MSPRNTAGGQTTTRTTVAWPTPALTALAPGATASVRRRRVHLPVSRDQQGAHASWLSFADVDRLAEQVGELADFVHEPVELVGNEGLRSVG